MRFVSAVLLLSLGLVGCKSSTAPKNEPNVVFDSWATLVSPGGGQWQGRVKNTGGSTGYTVIVRSKNNAGDEIFSQTSPVDVAPGQLATFSAVGVNTSGEHPSIVSIHWSKTP